MRPPVRRPVRRPPPRIPSPRQRFPIGRGSTSVQPTFEPLKAEPDTTSGPPDSFQPVPVESPGGGRIQDKRDPNPADVVQVSRVSGGSVPLHRLAARALEAMQRAARADGIAVPLLLPTSGYRSAAKQATLWKKALAKAKARGGGAKEARRWVAPPGGSAHQSGRAVDLYLGSKNAHENVAVLRKTAAWRWLKQNALRFGFYPYGEEPWHWEYNPPVRSGESRELGEVRNLNLFIDPRIGAAARAASPVVGEERTPAALTQIVKVPLRAASTPEWRQWSAVYFPPAVDRNSRTIDVILYLHGHRTKRPGARQSIWAYLKHKCWPLREHLAASGKAAVLIAPTLGPKSQAAGLLERGGLDRYLDAALAATASYWSSGAVPAIRHIVLAGHSGAGGPMRVLARSGNRYAALIKEVWGFDSTYSAKGNVDSTGWAAWAQAHPQSRLFIYYLRDTLTQDQAKKLSKWALPNVLVIESNAKTRENIPAHYWVPIQHWRERIAASPHLRR